jgi:hypothetical protein
MLYGLQARESQQFTWFCVEQTESGLNPERLLMAVSTDPDGHHIAAIQGGTSGDP